MLTLAYCRLDEKPFHLEQRVLWYPERWYSVFWHDDQPFTLALQQVVMRLAPRAGDVSFDSSTQFWGK